MKCTLSTRLFTRGAADLVVVPVFGNAARCGNLRQLDPHLQSHLLSEMKRRGFPGGSDEELCVQTLGALSVRAVVLVRCEPEPSVTTWFRLADATARHAGSLAARHAAVILDQHASPDSVAALSEGVALARYRFTRFRSQPEPLPSYALSLVVPAASTAMRRALARSRVTAAATCYARDLVNTPAGSLTPRLLAREARQVAGRGVAVKVHDRRAITRMRMGALRGVAQGSREEPVFIELTYRPPTARGRHVALVGKGITFDSGGLSLKTADSMQVQKRDMAGAAVVLAVMRALPDLRPRVEVRGYIPAAENMPGGGAIRPGDVLRACNGKTIEVLNADAEGRLVLADALAYAARQAPEAILDFATLTAAVRVALGGRYAAIMGSDRGLVATCISSATQVDEKLWELPLVEEYRRDIDSPIADLKNTGNGQAGTIVGGLFLREFVGEIPWAHIDFSSTAISDGYACHPKGASGFGVRTVLAYLEGLSADP